MLIAYEQEWYHPIPLSSIKWTDSIFGLSRDNGSILYMLLCLIFGGINFSQLFLKDLDTSQIHVGEVYKSISIGCIKKMQV